jgi:hypothetical protein
MAAARADEFDFFNKIFMQIHLIWQEIVDKINPNVAKVEGAADPRRQGCSCNNLPQTLYNAKDAVPSAFP